MPRKARPAVVEKEPRTLWGTEVTLRAIRRYAKQIAERFDPDQIILFGSHAYGTPNADSDVDLLVVMPARNALDQAYKIRLAVDAPFPLDLLVRTPSTLKWRLEAGDWFLREIVSRGKVLYAKAHGRLGAIAVGTAVRRRQLLVAHAARVRRKLCDRCTRAAYTTEMATSL